MALGLILAASFYVHPQDIGYQVCAFLRWTGYPCPCCGLTRSVCAWSQGEPSYAFRNSPLSLLIYLGLIGGFVWHLVALAFGRVVRVGPDMKRLFRRLVWVFLVLLLLNWVYRLAFGLK